MSKKKVCHAAFMIAVVVPVLAVIFLGCIQFGPL